MDRLKPVRDLIYADLGIASDADNVPTMARFIKKELVRQGGLPEIHRQRLFRTLLNYAEMLVYSYPSKWTVTLENYVLQLARDAGNQYLSCDHLAFTIAAYNDLQFRLSGH